MQLPQLEYSVRKKYTIPYLPHVFYVVLFLLLCVLVPLNVVLVGSDIITTLKDDPNTVEDPWWMPKFWPRALRLRIPDICQPQSITDDLALRTNSTVPLFKYSLRHARTVNADKDPRIQMYPAPYMANPFSDCVVQTIIWRMDIPFRTMSYRATIQCTLSGKKEFIDFWVPDNITLSMTHFRTYNPHMGPDDMRDHLAFNVLPKSKSRSESQRFGLEHTLDSNAFPADSHSANNVLAVLDGMQTDLFDAVWSQTYVWNMASRPYYQTYIVEWAAGSGNYCWSEELEAYNETCGSAIDPNRILNQYGTTNDWTEDEGIFIEPFTITIINMFVALRDAIMIDLGNIDPASNIYLNKSYFDEVIRTDSFHSDIAPVIINVNNTWSLTSNEYWNFCSYWACINTSWAQALKDTAAGVPLGNITLPYQPKDPKAKSVFSFSYLCPTFQRKPLNSLLVSVFVATATMFSMMYAVFDLLMPNFEERHQKRKQVMARAINPNPGEGQEEYMLVGGINVYDASNTLYDDPGFGPRKDKGSGNISPTSTEYLPVNARSYPYPVPEYNTRQ